MSLDIFLYQCTLPIEGQFCLTFCIKTLSLHFLSHRKYQISFILAFPEFAFLWNLIEIFIRLYFCQFNASFNGKYIIWKWLITNIAKEYVFIEFSRECIFWNYFFQCCTQIWLLKFSWAKFRACFCGKGGSFILFIVLLHFLFPVYVTYLSFAKSYSCIVQHAKTQKKRRKMQSHSSHYRKC